MQRQVLAFFKIILYVCVGGGGGRGGLRLKKCSEKELNKRRKC